MGPISGIRGETSTCMTLQFVHELFIITQSNRHILGVLILKPTEILTYKSSLPRQMTREIVDLKQPCRQTQALPSQTNHISVLLHITRYRLCLPTSVINLSFGTSLIRQQPLFLLCNMQSTKFYVDITPGATGQDPAQHIRGFTSSVGRKEMHPPTCPPSHAQSP